MSDREVREKLADMLEKCPAAELSLLPEERDLIVSSLRQPAGVSEEEKHGTTTGDTSGERVHDLKIWPGFFDEIERGNKTFEVRKDDRGYRAGDYLRLREWNPTKKTYSGRELTVKVTYLLCDPLFGITRGFVCMGIKLTTTAGLTGDRTDGTNTGLSLEPASTLNPPQTGEVERLRDA